MLFTYKRNIFGKQQIVHAYPEWGAKILFHLSHRRVIYREIGISDVPNRVENKSERSAMVYHGLTDLLLLVDTWFSWAEIKA